MSLSCMAAAVRPGQTDLMQGNFGRCRAARRHTAQQPQPHTDDTMSFVPFDMLTWRHRAAEAGDTDFLRRLSKVKVPLPRNMRNMAGVVINAPMPGIDAPPAKGCRILELPVDADGHTIAHIACFFHQHAVLQLCHELCPHLLCTVGTGGWVPAHDAAVNGHADTIELLHKLGATASLFYPGIARTAAAQGHSVVLRALYAATSSQDVIVDATADNDASGFTSAHAAASCGHFDTLKVLHELAPSSLSRATAHGGVGVSSCWTPAHAAASSGHAACLAVLGGFGVDLDRPSSEDWPDAGATPFQLACVAGKLSCVIELAVLGVDTSVTVQPSRSEADRLSTGIVEFLEILRDTAPLHTAKQRLAVAQSTVHCGGAPWCMTMGTGWMPLDIVEMIATRVTAARGARCLWTDKEMLRAVNCFDMAERELRSRTQKKKRKRTTDLCTLSCCNSPK